jgi:hypothetical protein
VKVLSNCLPGDPRGLALQISLGVFTFIFSVRRCVAPAQMNGVDFTLADKLKIEGLTE